MLSVGASVFIQAKITQKYAGSSFYDFSVGDIQFMERVKDQRIEKITIAIDPQKITEVMVSDLFEKISSSEGKTQVYIQLNSVEDRRNVTMRSKLSGVDVSRDLLMYIDNCEALSYRIN